MTGAGAVVGIVLLCWAVGLVAGATWTQSWSVVRRGHFRIVAWVGLSVVALAAYSYLHAISPAEGRSERLAIVIVTGALVAYLAVQYLFSEAVGVVVGIGVSTLGVVAIVLVAVEITGWPAWLAVPALLAGAGLLGAVTNGMLLGHWYLNQPGLKPWALARLTRAGLIVTVISAGVGLLAATRLAGATTEGAALGLPGFGADLGPAFYLIWLALVGFTGAVVYAALRCIQIRSIQSATGLYYVAILTAGVSEFLVRYLMVNVS